MFEAEAIFFDLDGTLVDSLPDLAFAVDQMMLTVNLPAPGIERVKKWVGNGAAMLIKRALTDALPTIPTKSQLDEAFRHFNHIYANNLATVSTLYKGVKETLSALEERNLSLACVTNKPGAFTQPLLRQMKIDHYFQTLICGDTLANKKPHPEPLWYAAEQCGIPIEECLMVGDSKNDVIAAREAGCQVVAVDYGYNHGEDIVLSKPDTIISEFKQLPELLR